MKRFKFYFLVGMLPIMNCGAACSNSSDSDPDEGKNYWESKQVDDWQEGYLDIHHISTGRGNCTFFVMPDGTTLLVDIGDVGSKSFQEILDAKPNDTKSAAQWVAHYIKHFDPSQNNGEALDYVMLTHFHGDHMGSETVTTAYEKPGKDYKLSGITELGNLLDIKTLIDRGYPDYNYFPSKDKLLNMFKDEMPNYLRYIEERDKAGKKTQKFEVGSNTQIALKNNPGAYDNFEIRNIMGSGKVWTGTGNESEVIIESDKYTDENPASCGFRLKYGKFTYYTGGDVKNVNAGNGIQAAYIETAVGNIVGKVDVVCCNHHAFLDAMCADFIKATAPKAFVIPVWGYNQPHVDALNRMLSTDLYPSERLVFATGELSSTNATLGTNGKKIKPVGHVLVRVYKGGDTFQIFVLNDLNPEKYDVIYKTDVLSAE